MEDLSPQARLAVGRMRAYIEEHLCETITQNQLARQAGYSPFHSARLFKADTGLAPFEYIRGMRLARSARLLEAPGTRVLDVALQFVFDSHEGFTRAFYRQFGVTPKAYALRPRPLPPFPPPDPTARRPITKEVPAVPNEGTVFVQILERPRRKLILRRGAACEDYYAYCEEVGCDVWETLCGVKEALYEPIGMWMPKSLRPEGTSVYAQGVEVPENYSGALPNGFELIELPACHMLVFQGPPYDEERYEEAIGELWRRTQGYDPSVYGFEWADEDAPRFQLAPMGYRGYIEGRPVRPAVRKA